MKKKLTQAFIIGLMLVGMYCEAPDNPAKSEIVSTTSEVKSEEFSGEQTDYKQPIITESLVQDEEIQNEEIQKETQNKDVTQKCEEETKSNSAKSNNIDEPVKEALNEQEINPISNSDNEIIEEERSQIYKYCPTNINGTILYCSNENNTGEIKDGIYLNGTQVLTTTSGAWDSAQVCDPSVISGNFTFNGNSYTYLMAYLGCATNNCTNNEIGFAVSNDLYNWIKVGKIISCINDGFWGVGQPSLMNLQNDGIVYLFYTSGTSAKTTTYVQCLNCNDLNNTQNLGQTEITTPYDFISNADFGYADGCLYMTCDTHPFSEGALNFISDKQTIYKATWSGTFEEFAGLDWQIETVIDSNQTGYSKNHNACFARDGYGNLVGRVICVSIASEVGDFLDNLFTYRIISVNF